MPRIKPFDSNFAYLTAIVDFLIALAEYRGLERQQQALARRSSQAEQDLDSFEEVAPAQKRQGVNLVTARKRVDKVEAALQARIAVTLKPGNVALPLEDLCRQHQLDRFEKYTLAILLACDMDPVMLRAIEQICSHSRGIHEVRTILTILCDSTEERIRARRYFVHNASLLSGGLLNISYCHDFGSESEFMSMDLALPRRIASLLLGEEDVNDAILAISSIVEPSVSLDQVVLPADKLAEVTALVRNRHEFLRVRKEWGFDKILPYGKGTVVLFSGPPGTGKTMLAHALAHECGHRLMLADLRHIAEHSRHDFTENLQRIFQEARILNAVLFFDEADEMFTDRCVNAAMPTLLREFEKMDGICILATNRPQVLDEALDRRILYRLDFEVPTAASREAIWRKHIPAEAHIAPDVDFHALAEEFEFSGGFIKNAVLSALAGVLQRTQGEQIIKQADLRAAARQQICNRLRAADTITIPKAGMADLLLPEDTMQQVRGVISAARQRQRVFASWGFGAIAAHGRGITALFSGDPGTGKTLAAEAIAHELGYGLRAIPLASLLDKFVGETERRITALFASVRDDGTVLLIDEADTLFGARMQRTDSHSHYINQQVNVLLRELERHDGVVILTTNRPHDLDAAFARRIRYHENFPLPDAAPRSAIWQHLLPANAPVADDVDLGAIGRMFQLSGGHIRSAVLRAAFAAATDGEVITQAILWQEAQRESPSQKDNRIGFQIAV